MVEFLQTYGIWIILGLLMLLMLRGHGAGCCGGGRHQQHDRNEKDTAANGKSGDSRSSSCH